MKEIKEIVEDGMEIGGSKSPDEIVEDKVLCKSVTMKEKMIQT